MDCNANYFTINNKNLKNNIYFCSLNYLIKRNENSKNKNSNC